MDAERRKDMRHKHYDCIVALAEGKNLECAEHESVDIDGYVWKTPDYIQDCNPLTRPDLIWRIKKEPVIEVKYYIKDSCGDYLLAPYGYKGIWDLKITYQDGKAIKAEVAE